MSKHFPLILYVIVIGLFSVGCIGPAYDMRSVSGFHDASVVICEGMSTKAVTVLLGPPKSIIVKNEYSLNNRLGAGEIWCYGHPSFAAIWFIVAFRGDEVSSTHIWDTLSTGWGNKLSPVDAYWQEVQPQEEEIRKEAIEMHRREIEEEESRRVAIEEPGRISVRPSEEKEPTTMPAGDLGEH